MSYVALATARFDEMARFYGNELGFPEVDAWDRTNGRGKVFDLKGLRLEILDASREARPLVLGPPGDRVHVVVEVDDVDEYRAGLSIDAPAPMDTSWGARLFRVRDPDGTTVTVLSYLRL